MAVADRDVGSGDICREGVHVELGRKRLQVALRRADPLPALIDHGPPFGDLGEHPASHPVPGFQNDHVEPGGGEVASCPQTRTPSSDDHHIGRLVHICHRFASSTPWCPPSGSRQRRSVRCRCAPKAHYLGVGGHYRGVRTRLLQVAGS